MTTQYDFPVSLQSVFTKDGLVIPRVRAVVRDDTKAPIATVSDRYMLRPHKEVMDAAESFVSMLGKPETKFFVGSNGATLVGEYTYTDKTFAVKDDTVGLRVYIENSYNAKKSLRIKIGALVLACTNGMVVPRDIYNMSFRHTNNVEIEWPKANDILAHFSSAASTWNKLANKDLGDQYGAFAQAAVAEGIVHENALVAPTHGTSVWDLYNQFTYHVTHNESKTASPIGKINRTEKIARWMDTTFA